MVPVGLAPFVLRPGWMTQHLHPLWWIAAAVAAVGGFYSPRIDRFLRHRPAALWLLLVAGAGVVAYALFGSMLGAKWSPIDDHEIMWFLGPDGRIGWSEIPRVLMTQTEVGHFGGALARYRPSYYFLRVL